MIRCKVPLYVLLGPLLERYTSKAYHEGLSQLKKADVIPIMELGEIA
jgi:hypothetical protein